MIDKMSDTIEVTIQFPITTCAMCGAKGTDQVRVMHASGDYCRTCAPAVSIRAWRHAQDQLQEGIKNGVLTIPTDDWSPDSGRNAG